MRNFITKVPNGLIYLLFLIPAISHLLISYKFPQYYSFELFFILRFFGFIVFFIWAYSLMEYFIHESKSDKGKTLLIVVMLASTILGVLSSISEGPFGIIIWVLSIVVWIGYIILMTKKIKSVFYARGTWFIAVELLFPVIGILTLTPEIKRWENSDKS